MKMKKDKENGQRKESELNQYEWPEEFSSNIGIKLPQRQPTGGLKFSIYIKDIIKFNQASKAERFCHDLMYSVFWLEASQQKEGAREFYADFIKEIRWFYAALRYFKEQRKPDNIPPWLNKLISQAKDNYQPYWDAKRKTVRPMPIEIIMSYSLARAYDGIASGETRNILIKHIYSSKEMKQIYSDYFKDQNINDVNNMLRHEPKLVHFRRILRKLKLHL